MSKYFITTGELYSAPDDLPGGSLSDSVKLTESDCGVIYEIYDSVTIKCALEVLVNTVNTIVHSL